jgi:putative ABC transport system permease protein
VEYHGANAFTQITGTTPNILQVKQFRIAVGRMFSDQDDRARRRLAVLGTTVLQNLGFDQPAAA